MNMRVGINTKPVKVPHNVTCENNSHVFFTVRGLVIPGMLNHPRVTKKIPSVIQEALWYWYVIFPPNNMNQIDIISQNCLDLCPSASSKEQVEAICCSLHHLDSRT